MIKLSFINFPLFNEVRTKKPQFQNLFVKRSPTKRVQTTLPSRDKTCMSPKVKRVMLSTRIQTSRKMDDSPKITFTRREEGSQTDDQRTQTRLSGPFRTPFKQYMQYKVKVPETMIDNKSQKTQIDAKAIEAMIGKLMSQKIMRPPPTVSAPASRKISALLSTKKPTHKRYNSDPGEIEQPIQQKKKQAIVSYVNRPNSILMSRQTSFNNNDSYLNEYVSKLNQ